jgi:DNA repair photolyase
MTSLPLPIFEPFETPETPLVGIAKMAAQGEALDPGHNVQFFTMGVRSILNRVVSKRKVPFVWSINPYRGCEFACKYCYARYAHEFIEEPNAYEFERKIYVKQNAGWLLRRDLKKVKAGEEIAIGAATDPYQPAERKYGVTRALLEEFAQHCGFEIGMITKSNLILRDLDLIKQVAEHNTITISLTVTTTNVELARKLEPRAPRPDLRLKAVKSINEVGIRCGVSCAPVLPGITDSPKELDAVIKAAGEAHACWVHINPLFLKPCSRQVFLPFVKEHFPHLVKLYDERYGSRDFATPEYSKRIGELTRKLCAKYGVGRRREERLFNAPVAAVLPAEEQMKLW